MLFQNKFIYYISLIISIVFIIVVFYMIFTSFKIVDRQFLDIDDKTYVNQVKIDEFTHSLAKKLTLHCKNDKICEVQSMLDFTTNIPYKVNESIARSARKVVSQNFGDCDDKSNLLISLLHVKGYEAYFVLVPKHIFVIVHLDVKQSLNKKALYVNGKAFYKLETTATNSKIGFPLKYSFEQIEAIIDPFENKKLVVDSLTYK
ncbi:hypothetical protein B0F89_1199 [Malaciobacter marinus]|uniref:Transglutaminase-like domain-containing protein n=1 Tax=Malaciobacter marinus TaxID=505249 RepID=A0AB36ZUN6_9BACT|nr:hypothetical protein [Malaciobacter marinus]PPK60556.1 hypothetical protein B0F89_1199 [Malaciobacter marinus]SKB51715.1 hypothetical protein SAMN06295997_11650 [Malaciobacter marinus]